jgi:RNA polymerase sigma factor (sigma-70 family)
VPEGSSDAELAARALGGEDAAFAELMRRHKAWTFRFIRRYVGDSDDAYDLLQDTFFSAWQALNRYQRERPFHTWLRRIALNKCRDRGRRQLVRRVLTAFAPHGQETAPEVRDAAPGPEAQASAEEELRQLEQGLEALPRQLKEPLLLTALEGLSHKDAAELLGINAKAVEMRVYRARTRLAELIAHQAGTPRGTRRGGA